MERTEEQELVNQVVIVITVCWSRTITCHPAMVVISPLRSTIIPLSKLVAVQY